MTLDGHDLKLISAPPLLPASEWEALPGKGITPKQSGPIIFQGPIWLSPQGEPKKTE